MDNAARTRQRVLALFLPIAAVLYISAEALSPKGTDQVITTTATALKVLRRGCSACLGERSGASMVHAATTAGRSAALAISVREAMPIRTSQ